MIATAQYPALSYYLSCYLNQDFEDIFGDATAALLSYKETETAEEQCKLLKEIKSLIDAPLTDAQLQKLILDDIDCNYYYPNEWSSTKDWLMHISTVLQEID